MKIFASSADVAALAAQAKSERKENQALVSKPILRLAPYTASLEYRASVGPAAIHEKEAEFFYVIDGSATMVTGGKLVGESRTNAENLTGTAIEGGNVAKRRQGRLHRSSGKHPALVQHYQWVHHADVASRAADGGELTTPHPFALPLRFKVAPKQAE